MLLSRRAQELPEQWENTKKIAQTVKQLVAPLQATEVAAIRRRVAAFDSQQTQYRDAFRRAPYFKYATCNYLISHTVRGVT